VRAVVVADTHLPDGGAGDLPVAAWRELERADVILHAGDVTGPALLARLAEVAPVHAVLGNNDRALVLPESVLVELDGVRVGMVHDSGPRAGREGRLRRRFPTADLVVFGHSHIPWCEAGLDGQLLLNPGSPTQRRGQPHRTVAVADLVAGRLAGCRVVEVD
jgi:putative phosphoesterase